MEDPPAASPDEPLGALLRRASEAPMALSRAELARLLSLEDPAERAALHAAALAVKRRATGPVVSLRGLVEIGNACAKDCYYCGLRRSNGAVRRYRIPEEDVVRMARWAFDRRFGSVVLQSGEVETDENAERIVRIVRAIRAFGGEGFAVVLSLGEQREEVYRAWREAGAARYLLRIETSNPALYRTLHPADHSWERRRDCLRALRRLGYQVGSGVMIGLPGQTAGDLADDIGFFAEEDIDMIGMGPFLPHGQTPLGAVAVDRARQLRLGLDMVAATRLQLHDRNIAATTVLQVLAPDGREQALLAGANVMMPNVTDNVFRRNYRLYEDKPCLEDTSDQCLGCIERRVASIGERIGWGAPGTSPHYLRRTEAPAPPKGPAEGAAGRRGDQ